MLQYYISNEDKIINLNLNYKSLKDLISQFNITNQEIKNIYLVNIIILLKTKNI